MVRGLLGAMVALMVLVVAGWAWIWWSPCWLGGCAPVEEMARFQAEGSQLYDVNGEPFATLATVNRRVVPIDSLPPHLIQAYLSIEDRRFYSHGGIDWRRMGGAVRQTATSIAGQGGRVEGGSTITMQLARNLFPEYLPYNERSMRRKVMEARVARQIERSFTKDKILELYLNHIYLGSGAYGVEAASQTYFGKPASNVNLAEAAVLAALPQAPSVLDPTRNPDRAERRRNLVLQEMAQAGYVTRAEADAARENPIQLTESRAQDEGNRSSYFVERVRRELEERVGSHFYTSGLRVHTTLDVVAQTAAEEELRAQLDRIEAGQFGHYAHDKFADARGLSAASGQTPYLQGAVVLMDAATGGVRALVGGRDWDDSKFDRAIQARRQAGSAFKPLVYLAALERMRTPVDLIDDQPLRMDLPNGQAWEPRNFGDEYDQMITIREALTRSKNTATVRLAMDVGLGPVVRTARELGVTSDIPEYPSTALGAADVRPIEMVGAYAAFTNGGYRVEPHFVQRVEDRNGRVLWEARPERRQVADPKATFVLTTMLRDVVDRGTATSVRAAGFSAPAAGKTGTTNDNSDVWFIGYTPDLVGAVWIGFDQPQRIIPRATGGSLAAPVWGRVMSKVYANRPAPEAWKAPPGVRTEQAERGTGTVVSSVCPAQGATYTEYFVGSPPADACRRDLRSPAVAADDRGWGDEEAGLGRQGDSLADRGIDWPELEQRLGDGTPASRPAPEAAERDRVRERDLPGTPATRSGTTGAGQGNTGARQGNPGTGQGNAGRGTGTASPEPPPADTTTPPPPVREADLPGEPVRPQPEPQPEPQPQQTPPANRSNGNGGTANGGTGGNGAAADPGLEEAVR